MKLLLLVSVCAAVALTARADDPDPGHAHAHDHTHDHAHDPAHDHAHDHVVPDRCAGMEMDAVALNENGVPYFFKGQYMFKGFDGEAKHIKDYFHELSNLDHIDAAFRMHNETDPHQHTNLIILTDDKVYSYHNHTLEAGYPKDMKDVFPGIPDHVDATLECLKPECDEDSILFFKGHDIFRFNIKTHAVDKKHFEGMPNCTSAFPFLTRYYCFHGYMFSRFDPKTGEVHGKYPKEARGYFMQCSNYSNDSDHVERERCSHVHLDAVTADDHGNMLAFRGHHFLHKDNNNTMTADTIEHVFKEVHSDVDAAFSYKDHLYIIKDDKVFAYNHAGESYALEDGYPKSLKEELGVDGHVDAAFVCPNEHNVHIITDQHIFHVDLTATPRVKSDEHQVAVLNHADTAMCGDDGVKVVVGNHFYHFGSVMLLVAGKMVPEPHPVSQEMLGCDH